jgi:glycine cleavage system H protein
MHWEERMPDYLETTVDKFIFKVATDRHYTAEGLWALAEGNRVRIGMTDFLQQRSGDIAFAEVRPEGTVLKAGDEVAVIETIKVNVSLSSPVSGTIVAVNPALELSPQVINQDPYGEGWLVIVEADNWPAERDNLLDAQAYFEVMKRQAEEEARQL